MVRTLGKLSAIAADKQTKPGRHSDGGGLYLNVSKTGSKSWLFMWVKDGRRREMGLGAYPAVGLKTAREQAADCRRRLVAERKDPIAERDRQVEKTFGECADEYVGTMERNWRNEKHRKQWQMTLDVYCQPIRIRIVAVVSRPMFSLSCNRSGTRRTKRHRDFAGELRTSWTMQGPRAGAREKTRLAGVGT